MSQVGLVLGAGGLTGQAYQSGVLAALESELGWDPRAADVVVGTSAGSLTASLLRIGISAHELTLWSRGGDCDPAVRILDRLNQVRGQLPDIKVRNLFRPWHLPRWTMVRRMAVGWELRGLLPLMASMLPSGPTSLVDLISDGWEGVPWPADLWICACRCRDGRRVVFGKDPAPLVCLPTAVAASSAIPGYFSAVVVEGESYRDGALCSSTNTDLLVDRGLDLVIVIAPMAGGWGTIDGALRVMARHRLRLEVSMLQNAGTPVVCFEPGRTAAHIMGFDPMAQDRSDRVVDAAIAQAEAALTAPDVRDLLTPLRRHRELGEAA